MILAIKAITNLFDYEKPAPKVVMCLSALVLMTFSSCGDSDDDSANQPETADMVRLISLQNETISGASGSGAGMSAYPGGSRYQTCIGGIAGMLYGGNIKGCTVVETNIYPVVDNALYVGGIVGDVSQSMVRDNVNYTTTYVPATLQDCLFAGNIFKKDENGYVGAI